MKKLHLINEWLIIITFLLYFSFLGGIIAHPILGFIQTIMSIKILINFKSLNNFTKFLLIGYLFITIMTIMFLKNLSISGINGLEIMFLWVFMTFPLALLHLYITYKIKTV